MEHLRYAGLPDERQRQVLREMVRSDTLLTTVMERAQALDLPDWLLVSGAVYDTVWNALTGRTAGHGIKDVDLFYFDASDTSYEAEDAVILRAAPRFEDLGRPVEIRNQARVHLWYAARFGRPYPSLITSADALNYFASTTHAVGVRFDARGDIDIIAPFGLDDMFSFRVAPNRALDNRQTHLTKGEKAQHYWPEVTIQPW